MISKKTLTALVLGTILTVSSFSAFGADLNLPERISGASRYETAVEISKSGWITSEYAVIARGDDYPDALCAAPLAKKFEAPILLTERDELNSSALAELKRLGVKTVFITGGTGAVSQNIENTLKENLKLNVERISGKNRYETSVKIAEKLGNKNEKGVFIVSGENYADALSAAPIAAKEGMPILLTSKESLSEEVISYLKNVQTPKQYIIGGKAVVDSSIGNLLSNPYRIQGQNRYETNAEILKEFSTKLDFTTVITAVGEGPTGKEFADALSGAALAAKLSCPVILLNETLPQGVESFINDTLNKKAKVVALGGSSVLNNDVIAKMKEKINAKKIKDENNSGNNIPNGGTQTGGSSTGGGAGTGGSTSNSDDKKEKLQNMSSRLEAVYSSLKTDKEKAVISKIKGSVDSLISNPNYNYKADVNAVKSMKNSLSNEENKNVENAILENINLSTITEMMDIFGITK